MAPPNGSNRNPPGVIVRPAGAAQSIPAAVVDLALKAGAAGAQKVVGGFSGDRVLAYVEALRHASIPVPKGARIGVRPFNVVMQAALTSAAPTASSDIFRVPAGEVGIVRRVRGFVRLQSQNTEAADVGNFTFANTNSMTPAGWKRLKSMNCEASIIRTDSTQTVLDDVLIDSMFAEVGAEPINMERGSPGWIELPGSSLRADFVLNDQSAGAAGAATLYGVVLEMTLISVLGAGTADPTDDLSHAIGRADGRLHPVYADAILRAGIKLRPTQKVSVRPFVVSTTFPLTTANPRDQATFTSPPNTVSLIREIRPTVILRSNTTESATSGNFAPGTLNPMTPEAWKRIKSNNAFMQFVVKNLDREVIRGDLPLSAASPDIGGEPFRFDDAAAGFVLAPNDTLQVSAALDATLATIVGADTRYGAVIAITFLEIFG
jgi:hypothetical protein